MQRGRRVYWVLYGECMSIVCVYRCILVHLRVYTPLLMNLAVPTGCLFLEWARKRGYCEQAGILERLKREGNSRAYEHPSPLSVSLLLPLLLRRLRESPIVAVSSLSRWVKKREGKRWRKDGVRGEKWAGGSLNDE